MDNTILCNIDMFAKTQSLQLPDGSTYLMDFDNIQHDLPVYCYSNNITSVHLFGDEQYLLGLRELIMLEEKTTYKKQSLEIEVN